jgi:hypothetical protein
VTKSPSSVASELATIAGTLDSIYSNISLAVDRHGDEWTVAFARHVIDRIANAEALLNEVKVMVDDAKREQMALASNARSKAANKPVE